MRRQIRRLLCLFIALSFIFAGQTYAQTKVAAAPKASSAIFDWKADYSHLSRNYNSVAYGKGLFVAVGEKGIISVSKDLKNWNSVFVNYITTEDYIGDEGLATVLFNGQVFVAAGGRNIFYSKDGYHWNKVAVGASDNGSNNLFLLPLEGVSYGVTNGKSFVLSGDGVLMYSTDGVKWTKNPDAHVDYGIGGESGTIFSNVIYDGKKFVSICAYEREDPEGQFIYSSVDGIKWDVADFKWPGGRFPVPSSGNVYYPSLYFNAGKYYMSGYESEDMKNWKASKAGVDSTLYQINGLTYKLGRGIYCLKNEKAVLQYRLDSSEGLNDMCTGNGKIIVVGNDGLILYADVLGKDITWNVSREQIFKDIYSAAANKACIVAVGKDGQIIRSTDGASWQIIKTNTTNTLHAVIYDGKSFIAAGDKGTMATSIDGSIWTLLPPKTKMNLYSVKKLNNTYIAVGSSGTILISKDASNWKLVFGVEKDKNLFNEPFSGVAYKDGTYYALSSSNSFVYTSKDAVTWKQTSRLKGSGYSDLIYYKGRFVLVGQNMSISKDMKTETINQEIHLGSGIEYPKINFFNDFLLTGASDGNVYLSPDGIQWQNVGGLKTQDCVNSIIEFKSSYYGFSNDGVLVNGIKKGDIALNSDITASTFYSSSVTLESQPVFWDGTMMMTVGTVSKLIRSDYIYDKKKKTAQISIGKKNIKFTSGSSYALLNGKKIMMPKKAEIIGSSFYVPAKFTFTSLGYTFSFDTVENRILINIDATPKNKSLILNPVAFKDNDGNLSFQSISYNRKTFVALAHMEEGGMCIICTSKDGLNWKCSAVIDGVLSKVLWNGKIFIAAGRSGSNTAIYSSVDGLNWQEDKNIPSGDDITDGAVNGNGSTYGEVYTGNVLKRTVLKIDGKLFYSKDGVDWQKSSDPKVKCFNNVCQCKGVFYSLCSGTGIVYYSDDGRKWNYYKTKFSFDRLISSGGTLWAVTNYQAYAGSTKLYKSKNGKDWSYISDLPGRETRALLYTGNKYILLGAKYNTYTAGKGKGFAMVSGNGDFWDFSAVPADFDLTTDVLRYGKLTLVATNKGLFTLTVK